MVARTDRVTDPKIRSALLVARRGQAYFSRKLNELHNDDFDEPSLLPGWSRRQLIAHVGLNARALTRLTEWAATGIETPMYSSPTQRNEEIEFTATLPTQALRNLSDHAAIHLNVEWRDLEPSAWTHEVRTALGRLVPVSETVWMRTREVWIHAVDLGNGGGFVDFPPELVDALLLDIQGAWARRREAEGIPEFVFAPSDRPAVTVPPGSPVPDHPVLELAGTAAQLAAWAAGRPFHAVTTTAGDPAPPAPRWF
ncbi:maleylpyruvate isomerase family mycothiol-dependent enzyme [Subtercola frigoramans]|uniref:Maleylpyruvate isomerase n=1 Tax=Subtercola frigoramans TaxID=120298 RepID=A0ABS2L9A9_9MICO|nr:maleylpyruvate isomerase family mycothiol-dependent enzyme [Subtercola frigoramans]MBM7473693.1 maleylpyruvate isomerase [Subtercola frigoramans]